MPTKVAQGSPGGGQDEAQTGHKRDQNRCRKRSRKKKLFKIVLEPSWGDLGSSWVPSWGQNRVPMQGGARFLKIDIFEKKRSQEATWDDLEPILGRFGSPRGSQNESRGGSEEELS